jgi:Asp-tRNA(Asn)/Glu-tRNA(Gln) amidotransferase A subunit family amidase
MSIPVAPTPAKAGRPALPVGLQLVAAALDEERLFSVASAVEASSPARQMALPAA